MYSPVIVGIDEAGRGPLAGPVYAGACAIPCELFRRRRHYKAWSPFKKIPDDDCILADSKQLEPAARERAFAWINQNCAWGVGFSTAKEIDEIGILAATEKAMNDALKMLEKVITPTSLLVDGRDAFFFPYPKVSIIGGDGLEPTIAAASIIAKVSRDRWMREQAKMYPQYGFEGHKGYGSLEHIDAIKKHGPCELHRLSFLTRILSSGPDPQQSTRAENRKREELTT